MRLEKTSQQTSQEVVRKYLKRSNQNQSVQNYQDNEDPVNCPLIFKACLVTLLTIGILAFIITFATSVQQSSQLYNSDFSGCQDSSNVRRLNKYYAYEKMIMGLSIAGLILAFGLTIFLIMHAYDFCRCFDDCYDNEPNESQSQSQVDMEMYQEQLKKRIKSNILVPKDQIDTTNIILPTKPKQQQQTKIKLKNQQIRKYLKSPEQIRKIDAQYNKSGKNTDQIQCDCQCDDCESCFASFVGCIWCKTCFEAHHYRFYKSKNQEYSYWIIYMAKTLFFGTALAYVIRIYVSIRQLDYCETLNARQYADNLYTPMVIGIITVAIDAFGYIHLFIEGSLLELVQETLQEKQKSEHSDSDQESESSDNDKKKKQKKYKQTSQSIQTEKPKKKSKLKKSQQSRESSQSQQMPTIGKLLTGPKKQIKNNLKEQQQKPTPSAKDTDSFFIKLKTLGNKYLDDIQKDQSSQSQQSDKKKKKKKQIDENQSEESYPTSNKKPQIFIPKNIDKLPKSQTKKLVMVKQQSSVKQEPFWKKDEGQKLPKGLVSINKQKQPQLGNEWAQIKPNYEKPIISGTNKFGAFSRAPMSSNTFNKNPIQTSNTQKNKNLTRLQDLSKYSTKF